MKEMWDSHVIPCLPLKHYPACPAWGKSRGSAFPLNKVRSHRGFTSLCRCTYSQKFVLFFSHLLFLLSFILLIGLTDWPQLFHRCARLGWRVFRLRSLEINNKKSQPAGKNKSELCAGRGRTENNTKTQTSQGCSFSFHNRFANEHQH